MKKIAVLLVVIMLLLSSCTGSEQNYQFLSMPWGESFEEILKHKALQGLETEIGENPSDTVMIVKGVDFYGYKVDVRLAFGIHDYSNKGLYSVYVNYNGNDEDSLYAKMTEIYGESPEYFSDGKIKQLNLERNSWRMEKTLGESLTKAAMEEFIERIDNTNLRRDAILRRPLVTISFQFEDDVLIFGGSSAATAREYNEQTK